MRCAMHDVHVESVVVYDVHQNIVTMPTHKVCTWNYIAEKKSYEEK